MEALHPIFVAHLIVSNFHPLSLKVVVHFIFVVTVLIFRGPIDTQT